MTFLSRKARVIVAVSLAIGCYFIWLGCATKQARPTIEYTTPKSSLLMTQGVTIEGRSESGEGWQIVPGQVSQVWMKSDRGPEICEKDGFPTPDDHRVALKRPHQRVIVQVEGRPEPVHGLLMFCDVWTGAGPATRVRQLVVPEERIAAADGGNVSVVYEIVPLSDKAQAVAWVLWLSAVPF
jgi:hypothetical protein